MYSAQVLDHFQHPRNAGEISHPDVAVEIENPACGDILRLTLKFSSGRISEIRFKAKGCVPSMACGSALTELVSGKTVDEARKLRREGVARGGYIAKREKGKLDLIIMSCGSELQHALAAANQLGDGARVVSMPCFERFNREPEEYREEILPNSCRRRVAIEAGVTEIWYQYVGLDGKVVGLHEFGLSAPGAEVMKERGIDAEHVIAAAKSLG